MRIGGRGKALAAGLLASLVVAAGAAGYSMATAVKVPRGGRATFVPSYWSCQNYGRRVECQTGDAYPYVTLTDTKSGGVTVKVHTLRDPQGGGLNVKGYPVYVFSALNP